MAQTAAVLPLGLLTMLVLGWQTIGELGVAALAATVQSMAIPLLVWAAAMAGLAALLRSRSAAARAGWSAATGVLLVALLPLVGGYPLPLLAAMLASCQAGWAAVALHVPRSRRIGFALGGAAAALAGAAAARMGFGAVTRVAEESDTGYGATSALIIVALIAAVVLSFRAGRKGWAALAIVGLAASALSISIAAPRQPDPGVRGGFDPSTVPDDYAECSFDASRPGCGG